MTAIEKMQEVAARASLKSRTAQREVAAAKTEKAEATQSKFQADFELVAEHFRLREHGEYEQALETAKLDRAGAVRCYASIAASLRRDNTAHGINQRIQARIEEGRKAAA